MPRKPVRRKPRARKRNKKSALVPALVLMSAAGAAVVAAGVLFSRDPAPAADDVGFGLPAPDVADIGAGGHTEIKLTDNDDRDRIAAVIAFDAQTPVGQGRYDTVNPRAWVYMDDGSYLHIRADEGRFYAPDEQRPQSGVMRGNVVIRLFEPAPERPADDAVAPITARLDVLDFDTDYGAVTSNSAGLVTTPEFEFAFNDIRLVINQVQERIELLEVRQGGRITYTPLPARPPASEVEAPISRRSPDPALDRVQIVNTSLRQSAPPTPPPPPPTPVHYLAHFRDAVRITQDAVTATGDALEVWARVVDNRLPEGAVGPAGDQLGQNPSGVRSTFSDASVLREAIASMAVASIESRWPPRRRLGPAASPAPTLQGVGGHEVVSEHEHDALSRDVQQVTPPEVPSEHGLSGQPSLPGPEVSTSLPVTLEWSGPLTVRPLAAEPTELRRDHLVARLTGGEGGGVNLTDQASSAAGVCTRLDYAFTTRSLVLAGVGETGVRLSATAPDDPQQRADPQTSGAPIARAAPGGTLRAGRAEYSLATGIGRVPGPGTLEGETFQRIGWNRQMDFVMRSDGDRVLSELEEVIFQGDVHGEDDAAWFDADYARAEFVLTDQQRSELSSITLEDSVSVRGREDERVTADFVRVEFAAQPPSPPTLNDPGQPEPTPSVGNGPTPAFFEADGDVLAVRPGERLAAGHVEATLTPGVDGRPSLHTLRASGDVDLRARRDDITILGNDLDVDLISQRLRVRGEPGDLARVARGQTVITGPDIRLAGQPRAASIFGAGTFSHTARADGASSGLLGTEDREVESSVFDAAWSQLMAFDDRARTLRCVGDVDATMTQGEARTDRLQAWTVEAAFDPIEDPAGEATQIAPNAPGDVTPGHGASSSVERDIPTDPSTTVSVDGALPDEFLLAPADEQDQNRRLVSVVATGSIMESPHGEPATIESRRYAPAAADGSRVLVQLYYLQGPQIVASNAAGTLDVPGSGKLMVVDRRTPDEQRPAPTTPDSSPFVGATARGDALFDWQGSLSGQRTDAGSSMTMTDRVRMTHRRFGDDLITSLEAPVLVARTGGAAQGQGERVQGVHAEGGVWVRSGDKEITADTVDYDADTGILTAVALLGNQVRVMDGPNVWTAAAIRWDMIAGRIEIASPGSIVSPR